MGHEAAVTGMRHTAAGTGRNPKRNRGWFLDRLPMVARMA